MTDFKESEKLSLEYGDVIEIHANNSSQLDKGVFFIDYIDIDKIRLVNTETYETHTIPILENRFPVEEGIQEIIILSKSDKKGYVLQNELTVGVGLVIIFQDDA